MTKLILGASMLLLVSVQANAAVIDFEGFASGGVKSDNLDETIQQAGFNIYIAHGHIIPVDHSLVGSIFPDNGTDYYEDDFAAPIEITRTDGGAFSAISFDASETHSFFARNLQIDVTALTLAGVSLSQSFVTDDVFGFETLLFGPGWDNLVQLSITNLSVIGAYDNVVLDPVNAVPEPATIWLFGTALIGMVGIGKRRKVA